MYKIKYDTVYRNKRDTVIVYRTKTDTITVIKHPVKEPLCKTGAIILVSWGGDWYPATVTEIKDELYNINYDGYPANWDEWVTETRIRNR